MGSFSLKELKGRLRKWGMDGSEEEPLTCLVLFRRGEKESAESWRMDGSDDVDSLAQRIESYLISDTVGIENVQYYSLKAYFGEQGKNPLAHLSRAEYRFDVVGDATNETDGPTDRPSPSGHLQQTMRLREVEHKQHHHGMKVLLDSALAIIDSQREALAEATAQVQNGLRAQIEAAQVVRAVVSDRHKEMMEWETLQSENRMKESLVDSAQLILPTIASRALLPKGKKPPKPASNPFVAELAALKTKFLQPEMQARVPALIAALDPFQGPFLMSFAQKLMEDEIGDMEIVGLRMFLTKLRPQAYRKLAAALDDEEAVAIFDAMIEKIMPPEEESSEDAEVPDHLRPNGAGPPAGAPS